LHREQAGVACGSKEEYVYFVRSGGFAARTNKKDRIFLAATGETRSSRREQTV
jgi:hypothetical protein